MNEKLKKQLIEKIVDFLKNEKNKKINYDDCYININHKNDECTEAKISFRVDNVPEKNINILYSINRIDIELNDCNLHTIHGDDENFDFISCYIRDFFNNVEAYTINNAIELLNGYMRRK